MTVPDVTSHYSDTMKNSKKKVTTRSTRKPRNSYDGPTSIKVCLQMYQQSRRQLDDWLVAICQHVRIQGMSRESLAELLYLHPSLHYNTREEAQQAAGRIWRLSRNEDALRDIKYGTIPIAKRITLIKAAM